MRDLDTIRLTLYDLEKDLAEHRKDHTTFCRCLTCTALGYMHEARLAMEVGRNESELTPRERRQIIENEEANAQ